MPAITFTHEEKLKHKWLVDNTEYLSDDDKQIISLKLKKLLEQDGERLVLGGKQVRYNPHSAISKEV